MYTPILPRAGKAPRESSLQQSIWMHLHPLRSLQRRATHRRSQTTFSRKQRQAQKSRKRELVTHRRIFCEERESGLRCRKDRFFYEFLIRAIPCARTILPPIQGKARDRETGRQGGPRSADWFPTHSAAAAILATWPWRRIPSSVKSETGASISKIFRH